MLQHRASQASKRLQTIPGIGIVGATAIAATVTDPKAFRSGRDFAAWIGLVPRQRLASFLLRAPPSAGFFWGCPVNITIIIPGRILLSPSVIDARCYHP